MKSSIYDKKTTKDIRIDISVHDLLKIEAVKRHTSIKNLVEGCLAELLAVQSV